MNASSHRDKFNLLTSLIKEVKPSLVDTSIKLEDTLTEHLGLDSLDILQLVRKIRRSMGGEFDLDSWSANKASHRGSVTSLLAAIGDPVVA